MTKTLRISFSLKNTYRVNSILYAIKQIPLIKKFLPDRLYQVQGLKILANVLSVIWEVISFFGGKLLYLLIMVAGAASLYGLDEKRQLFLHIFFFLTITGSFMNTYMFNPTRDKYYILILLRINAREYTLINYGYSILKVLLGFLLFGTLFGMAAGVPLWQCLLLPLFVAGLKLSYAAYSLYDYDKNGIATNENKLGGLQWIAVFLLLAAAYGLPALHILLPEYIMTACMLLSILAGILSIRKILTFSGYREVYQQILTGVMSDMDTAKQFTKKKNEKLISSDVTVTSSRKGFEYLNELFIKRHQKILWKSAKRIAAICFCLILAVLLLFYLKPETKEVVNTLLLTFLPYFVFIMYSVNRGTDFTKALFMNCDHSLLTYSFYKQPKFILKLFQIRLREITKINLLPALVIGAGLAVLLYASGGTDNPLHYLVLPVSILCMSIFFSVHYLTIYYLLQPYNAGTELKSGTYQLVIWATYFVCFMFMKLQMPTLIFGLMTIVFCVLYCIVACILAYLLAPKTFRLRA